MQTIVLTTRQILYDIARQKYSTLREMTAWVNKMLKYCVMRFDGKHITIIEGNPSEDGWMKIKPDTLYRVFPLILYKEYAEVSENESSLIIRTCETLTQARIQIVQDFCPAISGISDMRLFFKGQPIFFSTGDLYEDTGKKVYHTLVDRMAEGYTYPQDRCTLQLVEVELFVVRNEKGEIEGYFENKSEIKQYLLSKVNINPDEKEVEKLSSYRVMKNEAEYKFEISRLNEGFGIEWQI